jgi:serine/threonine protein kinase
MKLCNRCQNFFPDDLSVCPVDKVELISSEDKFVGKIVAGAYRVLSMLAKGGMGTVYLAKHRYLEREVAVKILKPSISGNEESRKRIVREAKICATIEHPNIVKVYDLATLNGSICLVMELLEGLTLKDMLMREGALNVERAVRITGMTAEALARAHSFDIVHRDIKPGNIFLTHHRGISDFVKLLDFGIAFTIGGSRLTKEGILIGTPPYISPEQIRGEQPTESSDIYSLGCVVYEMLSGRSPFAAQKMEDIIRGHLFSEPEPIIGMRPDLPQALHDILMKMLDKDPRSRYQDAFHLLDDLKVAGLTSGDMEVDGMARVSDQPVKSGRETKAEISWNEVLSEMADDLDEDTAQTREFRLGLEAARELQKIEQEMKLLVEEMEEIDQRRREYQKNIGVAVDSLEIDLSKIRRKLGSEKMESINLASRREYLVKQARSAETKLGAFAGHGGGKEGAVMDEQELALILELGEIASTLKEIHEEEKKIKRQREEHKAQVEDLKFQIMQLNRRYFEIKEEYSEKYEAQRARLDDISSRGEGLRKLAAMAAYRAKIGDTTEKQMKGE